MVIYRFLFLLVSPILAMRMLWALLRGQETKADILQRLGRGTGPADGGPWMWLHGASLGELTAARQLVEDLLSTSPAMRIVVTSNTLTGRSHVEGWGNARVVARLAPLDARFVVARFLTRWQPIISISLENEFWPTRLAECRRRDIPIIAAMARMSDKTARAWGIFPNFSKEVMGQLDALFPLDAAQGERFGRLGVDDTKIHAPLNMKLNVVRPPVEATDAIDGFGVWPRAMTILAASTHVGEDEIILEAFAAARRTQPTLRLILAPRHAKRSAQIATLVAKAGFQFNTRSEGEVIDINNDVYLADTIGEMSNWYELSTITIVGGTFAAKGGHTPIEPVMHGSIVVHGPDVANHRAAFAALDEKGLCFRATSATDLARTLTTVLARDDQEELAERAQQALRVAMLDLTNTSSILAKISELTAKF